MAAVWQTWGVSWRNIEPLLCLMLAWSALAIYGLMRFVMGRTLAAAFTALLVVSPALLANLPDLRDFSKAPFILSIVLLSGGLLKGRPSAGRICVLSVAIGVLSGVAMGFRQDVLALAPESPHTAALLDASCGKLGNPDACIRLWEELVKIHPESPVLNQHLNSRRTRE